MNTIRLIVISMFLVSNLGVINTKANDKGKTMPHILVIGIDGLGAHGLGMAETPNLDKLMKNGAYSLEARTVVPSSSGPAWTSMITGATVEIHGVGNNSWKVDNKILEPIFKGEHNMFPTIFGEIRKNTPKAVIGAFYHWGKLINFIEKGVCDLSSPSKSEDAATQIACNFLSDQKPNMTFVHLDHVDHAGHHGGYRSAEYAKSITKADSLVGIFIKNWKK